MWRRPLSVLVLVYTAGAEVLLLRRRRPFSFWQSVTGGLDDGERHAETAERELAEETGIRADRRLVYSGAQRVFVIDPRWRDRYAPGIVENAEFEWRLELPERCDVTLAGDEHDAFEWVDIDTAIERVWSWTNREALECLREERWPERAPRL